MLFNVLKNGCKVEEFHLGTIERVERALALYLVVAWRKAYLMRMGRICPGLNAKLLLNPNEIQAAYLLNKQFVLPAPEPNEVLRIVARIVGSMARRGDGEHDARTTWEGRRDVRMRSGAALKEPMGNILLLAVGPLDDVHHDA